MISISAPESGFQHYEREKPRHGGRGEEEVRHEATTGGPGGNQENFLCQLHGHLQTVSLSNLYTVIDKVHHDTHMTPCKLPNHSAFVE